MKYCTFSLYLTEGYGCVRVKGRMHIITFICHDEINMQFLFLFSFYFESNFAFLIIFKHFQTDDKNYRAFHFCFKQFFLVAYFYSHKKNSDERNALNF